jgi:hypothetical protein
MKDTGVVNIGPFKPSVPGEKFTEKENPTEKSNPSKGIVGVKTGTPPPPTPVEKATIKSGTLKPRIGSLAS